MVGITLANGTVRILLTTVRRPTLKITRPRKQCVWELPVRVWCGDWECMELYLHRAYLATVLNDLQRQGNRYWRCTLKAACKSLSVGEYRWNNGTGSSRKVYFTFGFHIKTVKTVRNSTVPVEAPLEQIWALTSWLERLRLQLEGTVPVWRRYDERHTGVLLGQNTQYHEDTNTTKVVQEYAGIHIMVYQSSGLRSALTVLRWNNRSRTTSSIIKYCVIFTLTFRNLASHI